MKYYGQADKMGILQFMGDAGVRGGAMVSRYAVIFHIHRPLEGKGSTLGGPMTTPGGLCVGKLL